MPDRTFRHRRRWARRRARSMCLGLVGAILAGPAVAAAPQQPPPQTLKELSVTLNHTLGRPFSFQFTPDGQTLLYLRSGARDRDTKLYAFDVASKQERLVASAEDLLGGDTQETAAERAARERKRIKLAGLSSYTLSAGGDKILISNSGKVFIHDLKKNRTDRIQLPEGELANPKLSPDGDKLAFVLDYNLYVARLSPPGKKGIKTRVTRLTRGGTVTASFGVAEFVAQEEMSRHDGFWWSPDSKRILYQATDQSELDRFTIADAAAPEKAAEVFPYPRAGRNNAEVRLFIVNTSGRRRTEVRWNRSTWAYVAKVRWPRNRHPTVLLQARDQRSQAYMRIDPKSGATTAMHREEDAAWLNIHDSTPWWLEDGSYLWASEADSAWALYRYTPRDKRAGSKRRAVIVGPDAGFNSLLHVDEAGGWVWFSGGLDPTQNHIYRAPLGGGPVEQITEQDGYNDATVSPDGTNVVIAHASLSKLPEAHLYSATGPIKESKT
ncbi:MAG: DPP IV N-terminal domain-containing protein, partial [Myxococcota bacterium]